MIQLKIIGENKMISVTVVNKSSLQLWKVELVLNSLTKMKRWRNFTHDGLLATAKIVVHEYILLHIARRNLFHSSYWIINCNYYLIFQ